MTPKRRLRSLLDRAHDGLTGDAERALSELRDGLAAVRAALSRSTWKTAVHEIARPHPLSDAVLASPLARRSRSKPRGDGVDAILLDMIYAVPGSTNRDDDGAAISAFERALPSIASYREACAGIRQQLTRLAAARPGARVLALGCGHLREVDTTLLARFGPTARIVAVDADPAAIAAVRRRLVDRRVRAVCADPAMLADASRRAGAAFDLVYRIAPEDTVRGASWSGLFAAAPALLRPDGTLTVAVLAEQRPDAGYLEALLDWWPPEHDRERLTAIATGAAGDRCSVTVEQHGVLLLVTAVRRASAGETQIGRYEDGGAVR